MSADTHPPELPKPTLFISYASQDRDAARRICDTLIAQGIDVWYDEEELTGGDAWDQMIRQRIRECDYFMPVISGTTQRRREGYFRREWRQAAERTLDMADDVMFILPVNISEVGEATARVPEQFKNVHWTRCSDGEPNAALTELGRRILRGDDAVPAAKPSVPRTVRAKAPAPQSTEPTGRKGKHLPPYPPQPQRTENEAAWLHVFNLMVWVVRCMYRAYIGFPRILRIIVILWLLVMLMKSCQGPEVSGPTNDIPDPGLQELLDEVTGPNTLSDLPGEADDEGEVSGFGKFLGAVADIAQAGRTLAMTPFYTGEATAEHDEYADQVFQDTLGRLQHAHREELSFSPMPLGIDPNPTALAQRIGRTEATYLLTGWVEAETAEQSARLHVVLHPADPARPRWIDSFAIADHSPQAVAEIIAAQIAEIGVFESPSTEAP